MTNVTALLIALSLAGSPVANVAACLEWCALQQTAAAQDDCMNAMAGLTAISDDSAAGPAPVSDSVFIREESRPTFLTPVSLVLFELPAPLSVQGPAWTAVRGDRAPGANRAIALLVLRL